jgi:hypothetical protein
MPKEKDSDQKTDEQAAAAKETSGKSDLPEQTPAH